MNKYNLPAALLIIFVSVWSSSVLAEASCETSITYKWQKSPEEVFEVFWLKIKTNEASEDEAKKKIEALIDKQKIRAMVECRRQHENLSGCIGTKYESATAILSRMGFTAREELEKAIGEDCRAVQGRCDSVHASEVKCEVEAVAHEEGEGEEKKEEKGKKKKKKKH